MTAPGNEITGPDGWAGLSGRLHGGMEIIEIIASAAAGTWDGPQDAGPLRKRLREIAALAGQYAALASLAARWPVTTPDER
jgi:hypothetical protein